MAFQSRERTPSASNTTRKPTTFRKKTCPFKHPKAPKIDWKNPKLLGRFISDTGRIIPTRITSVSAPKQREVTQAIKRARFMAVLPYAGAE